MSHPPTDRNILFGVLAVQHHFVSHEALAAALSAWSADPSRALGQVLLDHGDLRPEDRATVEVLVEKRLREQAAATESDQGPTHVDPQQLAPDPLITGPISTPPTRPPSGLEIPPTLISPPPDSNEARRGGPTPSGRPQAGREGPRYQVLRPHARGGLGQVYVAYDLELQREVALKEIHPDHSTNRPSCDRFLFEAEITGRLEHPGIVPVYGLGTYADGRPYYAMRFIRGEPLSKAIQRFHEHVRAAKGPQELELRQLLRRFQDVCNAIAFSHSKGVIHRDIKPDNIMLGEFGETLVVDWGLAKILGTPDEPPSTGGPRSFSEIAADASYTRIGDVLGTPMFMSPEQAAGRLDLLGPASDVYSLGATLYYLLTCHMPFDQPDTNLILHDVRKGRFPPPRQINPHVPSALEAVCLKAMSRNPKDRYASATALAEDVENWLGDEPVSAYPEPWTARLNRWRRRHPALVGSAAALVFTALVTLSITFILLSREQSRTLAEADRARQALAGRALAQVDALLAADPKAVPAILEGLEPFRDEVLPRLREVRDQEDRPGESPRQRALRLHHRTRAALALLAVEEGQADFLGDRLLSPDVEPEEFLLLRESLAGYGDRLKEPLWEVVDENPRPGQRFRALVALARFDPENRRWSDAAEKLVGPLVDADPLHIGLWAQALQPVRGHLLVPLARVFRNRDRESDRRVATGILQDYAADRPDFLLDLLLDADPQQFALLLPRLKGHAETVIPLLRRELRRQPQPVWPDPPIGLDVPEELSNEIARAHGLLTARFALVQSLPLDRFDMVNATFSRRGYRPTRLRPYRSGDRVLTAAVWARDGLAGQAAIGLTPAEVRQRDERLKVEGYRPADVAGYRPSEELRFAAVWVKAALGEEGRLYVDVASHEHRSIQDRFRDEELSPLTVQAVVAPAGGQRYSGVWVKSAAASRRWSVAWDAYEHQYAETLADPSRVPADVSLTRRTQAASGRAHAAEQLAQAEHDLTEKPGDPAALLRRGVARLGLGEATKAAADLDAVLEKSPDERDAYYHRALARARLGRAKDAESDLAEYRKRGGKSEAVFYLEAALPILLGRERDGLDRVQKEIKEKAKEPVFLFEAARLYALASRVQERKALGDDALAVLDRAAKTGFADWARVATDPDFDPLRGLPGFIDLVAPHHLERAYAFVLQGGSWTGNDVHGLSPEEHLKHCRQFAEEGYRPTAVSVVVGPKGEAPVAASVWQRPAVRAEDRDALARRQANAAGALLHLGSSDDAWPFFRHTAHPDVRSYLVQRCGPLGVDARLLSLRLSGEQDVSARRALVLALGGYSAEQLPEEVRKKWLPQLLQWYAEDPDPGLHAAIDWLLRPSRDGRRPRPFDWGTADKLREIDTALKNQPAGERRWSVNKQGQTMLTQPGPAEYLMGSPGWEPGRDDDERRHWQRVPRRYALSAREITVAEFKRFLDANPMVKHSYNRVYSPDPDGPAIGVTWYEAVQYCRWLSDLEKIPEDQMCYPSIGEIEKCKDGVTPLKMPADYLTRTGYRLPTEPEWEFSCRAGASSARFFGSSAELLDAFAWTFRNSTDRTWPVGQKKPNDYGLFDTHGNAAEWCHETAEVYGLGTRKKPQTDAEDVREVTDRLPRVLRGGSFDSQPADVRSAYRDMNRPSDRLNTVGFRVARTLK